MPTIELRPNHARRPSGLEIGNAGGVDLMLNGTPLGDIGTRGKVVALEITKEGINRKR
ncbi:MAG: hypothetical protein ONB05_06200 [candidate division KSB1 bacterium]|nr:hypothetical protein [candidate division KSB1 bacterium]